MFSNQYPYGGIESREELYYKIQSEPPLSLRYYVPTISNSIDNLIIKLLEKKNYLRPNSIKEIRKYLESNEEIDITINEFEPSFYLKLWNEKKILTDFYNDGNSIENAIFPINHQTM